jgi:hypothetical protein
MPFCRTPKVLPPAVKGKIMSETEKLVPVGQPRIVRLLPCPFCGCKAVVKPEYNGKQFRVGCEFCAIYLKPWRQQRDAEQIWNMRIVETVQRDLLDDARAIMVNIRDADGWPAADEWIETHDLSLPNAERTDRASEEP